MPDLGQLRRRPLRDVWTHEALDFTPWLAQNIERLGAALGLELEVEQEEADAGDFSLDILATDLGSGRKVVIENQLEPTDHRHLGQVLTYAAHFEASTVVWVSSEFRDEHLRTLDWLNRVANEEIAFFGVVVEVLQIDDSKPAAELRVVSSPPQWRPTPGKGKRATTGGGGGGGGTDRKEAYRNFFQRLIDVLREKHRFTNAKVGQPQNWYSFSSGVSGLQYSVSFSAEKGVRVELYIDAKDEDVNEQVFDALLAQKAEIEKAFGEPLSWERLEGRRACRVAVYRPGSIEDSEEVKEQILEWATDRIRRVETVFRERAKLALARALAGDREKTGPSLPTG